jgi:hypothetical protein
VAKIRPQFDATLFVIVKPQADMPALADGANTVLVQVRALQMPLSFRATITDLGGGTTFGSGPLGPDGTGNQFSAQIGVGGGLPAAPTGHNNRTVLVEAFRGSTLADKGSNDFEAVGGGSGSGSVSHEAHRCPFCREGRPVPVELRVRFEPPVGCLWAWLALLRRLRGRPPLGPALQSAVLVHSPRAGAGCSWMGEPIAAFSDRDDPAFWRLEKSSPTTWGLGLRRGGADLVAYRHTTPELDCSFPITLSLVEGAEGEGWPSAVTVYPA